MRLSRMACAQQVALCRAPVLGRQHTTAAALRTAAPVPTIHRKRSHGRQSVQGRAAQSGSGGGRNDSGGSEEQDIRSKARLLNELFFAPSATVSDYGPGSHDSFGSTPSNKHNDPLMLHDLPLWRVQWAALPGSREVLHVHVPHYCAMFEGLFRQPRPWRFGHALLPEGSKNLGNPEYTLAPGTKAPLVGTLMEVQQAVRFGDGRLLMLAVGVGRIRIIRPTLDVPYSRADAELLPDAEEQQQFEGLALQVLDSVSGGFDSVRGGEDGGCGELPVAALTEALSAAARDAAAAYGLAWMDYELSESRQGASEGPGIIDGNHAGEAQLMGRRLAAIAGHEVMELPFWEALASAAPAAAAVEGAAEGAQGAGSSQASNSSGALQEALGSQRLVLRQTESAAYALATSAAAACVARHLEQPLGSAAASSSPLPVAPPSLNTASERGIPCQSPEEVLDPAECLSSEPDSLAVALQLEAAVWHEIASVHGLASKLRERAMPLPEGLRCLKPWQSAIGTGRAAAATDAGSGPASGKEENAEADAGAGDTLAGPGAHPDYPALRRVQRLSFGVTSLLANVTANEGRQAWVEAASICSRLRLGLAALRKHRQVLAAVVAVEGL